MFCGIIVIDYGTRTPCETHSCSLSNHVPSPGPSFHVFSMSFKVIFPWRVSIIIHINYANQIAMCNPGVIQKYEFVNFVCMRKYITKNELSYVNDNINNVEGWDSTSSHTCITVTDILMGAIASQITSLTIVYWIVYSEAAQRKHQSSASLAFVHRDRWIPHTNGQ